MHHPKVRSVLLKVEPIRPDYIPHLLLNGIINRNEMETPRDSEIMGGTH